jgi:hypothetical protein
LFLFAFFQPIFPNGDVPERNHDLPKDTASSQDPEFFLESEIVDHTAAYVQRVVDIEGRVKMLKQQVIIAMEQAKRSSLLLLRTVSSLEGQLSTLKSKIAQLEDGDHYMSEILEAANEQLNCKFLGSPECFCRHIYFSIIAFDVGTCLDAAAKDLRVNEWIAVLDRVSAGTGTFWSNARRCRSVVRLQDRADHIGESVEGCRKALTTVLTVMLPRNPPLEKFHQLLDALKSSKHAHRLVKLQLVAGAQFALTWLRKWKPQIDFETISKGFLPHKSKGVILKIHLDVTLEPAKRMINRLLEAETKYFEEHHYLDPVGSSSFRTCEGTEHCVRYV